MAWSSNKREGVNVRTVADLETAGFSMAEIALGMQEVAR